MKPKLGFSVLLVLVSVSHFSSIAESKCSKGCDLALASYYVVPETNLTFIAQVLQSNLNINPSTIVSYNKQTDSASSESNVEGEEATIPTASSQSKTVSCSAMAKHKTRLKSNGVVSH